MSRVVLRSLELADAPALTAYRNHPDVARYQGWRLPYSLEEAEALISAMRNRVPGQEGWTQLALADALSGELLGDFAVRGEGEQAEIGVTLAPQAQGRGLALEGLCRLLAQLFGSPGLRRVYASIDPRNRRAASLLSRAGFRHEGTTLASYLHRGQWTDEATYALLAHEWSAHHTQENPSP
ncbi:GNAT family N-acetyltransferase [Deinococcus budaensis]|uniref:RimJ/RimL family protein N-acetyltransferase n=1 Tax=Deinococcus budaensis TaxID=1665626 RepID=A0A7W8LR39_9DEIO|nr:GNAT family protein [Deinococcus budaensis]MBB5235267.1 RimJ/RimL family protein N-acetyltransferase [Deinococcus budaensis]